jgi:microsomal dipeptidase-like Zn-dependent dipeptidase
MQPRSQKISWFHRKTLRLGAPLAAFVATTAGAELPEAQAQASGPLVGYVDLHTHPMSHLGFGRKALHGAPDVGMIVPAGTRGCNVEFRATSMLDALDNCNASHGGYGINNTCGDYIRAAAINLGLDTEFEHKVSNVHGDHQHAGYPKFEYWPHHSSKLHQQMWWEWVKRAHTGGQRVMVALTVNSETLATVLNGQQPFDDRSVADLQIVETKRFVNNHKDFMEIAYSSADAERIVRAGKLAVILGMEVDKLGNFGKLGVTTTEGTVRAEIQRLHAMGIRYAFPVHLIDNAFSGTAVYNLLFNISNLHLNGKLFSIKTDPSVSLNANIGVNGIPGPLGWENATILGLQPVLVGLGQLPAPCFNDVFKCGPLPGKVRCCGSYDSILKIFPPTGAWDVYKLTPPGHVNALPLTALGKAAIAEMMRLGMLIDLDHMSQGAMTQAIAEATKVVGGYPLLFGHSSLRTATEHSERHPTAELVKKVAQLGGMFGVGTAKTTPANFIKHYDAAYLAMTSGGAGPGALAIGTDANGFERLPHHTWPKDDARSASFYTSFHAASPIKTKQAKPAGTGHWDYIKDGGVSHYGLMPEFLHDVKRVNVGGKIHGNLMTSADYFVKMWRKAETVRPGGPPRLSEASSTPSTVATTGGQVQLRVKALDNEGVITVRGTLKRPDGGIVEITLVRTSGTAKEGIWQGAYSAPGNPSPQDATYELSFKATDTNANAVSLVGPSFIVKAKDQVAPTIGSFTVDPTTLPYLGGSISVLVKASDAVGVTNVQVVFTKPDGTKTGVPALALSSGTAQSGEWKGSWPIGGNTSMTSQVWGVSVSVSDAAGNVTHGQTQSVTVGPKPTAISPPKLPF